MNDLVAQREMAEMAIDGLHENYRMLSERYNYLEDSFEEYKNAMESYMGRSRVFEALEQYKNEQGIS